MIQKYCNGYLCYKKFKEIKQDAKIEKIHQYFTDMRKRLEMDAVRIIRLYYLRFKVRKTRKLQEQQRLEENKKKGGVRRKKTKDFKE